MGNWAENPRCCPLQWQGVQGVSGHHSQHFTPRQAWRLKCFLYPLNGYNLSTREACISTLLHQSLIPRGKRKQFRFNAYSIFGLLVGTSNEVSISRTVRQKGILLWRRFQYFKIWFWASSEQKPQTSKFFTKRENPGVPTQTVRLTASPWTTDPGWNPRWTGRKGGSFQKLLTGRFPSESYLVSRGTSSLSETFWFWQIGKFQQKPASLEFYWPAVPVSTHSDCGIRFLFCFSLHRGIHRWIKAGLAGSMSPAAGPTPRHTGHTKDGKEQEKV